MEEYEKTREMLFELQHNNTHGIQQKKIRTKMNIMEEKRMALHKIIFSYWRWWKKVLDVFYGFKTCLIFVSKTSSALVFKKILSRK